VTAQTWLQNFLQNQGGIAGSIHRKEEEAELLELVASVNLPPPVVEKTRHIPKGKGMAGLAWERNRAVSTCNLQTDSSGDVQPGAKAVNAQAAVAIPVHDAGGRLRAVVGIAFAGDRDFSEDELRALEQLAASLPMLLHSSGRRVARTKLATAVARIPLSASDLAERLEAGVEPLLIAGGARHYRAFACWSIEYLSDICGQVEIQFKSSSSNAHPDFRQPTLAQMFARGSAPFGEFLRGLVSGPAHERARRLFTGDEQFLLRRRRGTETIHPELGRLLDDVEVPALFARERLHTVWSWFSGLGVRTWLHYDNNGCHNLNAQITGHKRCALYPPSELARMHPFVLGGDNPAHNCSAIDVEAPQPAFADDLADARVWHAEVLAGDLLFIPAWWFHTFEHLGELNSNVNFWWRPERPQWNATAARQALLDAASSAELGERTPALQAALRALDVAAIGQPGA